MASKYIEKLVIRIILIFILFISCNIKTNINGNWISTDKVLYNSTKLFINKNDVLILNFPIHTDIFGLEDKIRNGTQSIEAVIDFKSLTLLSKKSNEEIATIQFYTSKEIELHFFDGTVCTFIKK